MHNLKLFLTLGTALALTACGGGGGGGDDRSPATVGSSSIATSSSSAATSSSGPISEFRLKDLADFPIGVAVSAGNEEFSIFRQDNVGASQRAIIEHHFDQMTAGNIMKMSYLQPQQENFTYQQADQLLDYANENNISIHGHALVWHPEYQIPQFMQTFEGDEAAWMELMKNHVQSIAAYYSGKVPSWDVVNEAFFDNGSYRDNDDEELGPGSLFYRKMGEDYIEAAFINTRAADPVADLYYNDYNLSAGGAKLNAVLAMVDDFKARDIPIDGVGFQMHINMDFPSIDAIRSSFGEVVERGLKVKITELDIPFNNPFNGSYNYPNNYISEFTPARAQAQKVRYCQIMEAYLEVVPADLRGGFTVWGVYDGDTWLKQAIFNNNHDDWPLLFDHDFQPKPALDGVAAALRREDCN